MRKNDSGDDDNPYLRYKVTEDGVSPQRLPSSGPGLVRVSGNEHDPEGHISENAANKIAMTQKRAAKVPKHDQRDGAPADREPGRVHFSGGLGVNKRKHPGGR